MRISILQIDIVWENKCENLQKLHQTLKTLRGTTDLVILPEMFSTGFSMNSHSLAESLNDTTMQSLQKWSSKYRLALAGSYIAIENGAYYNRAFFITPTAHNYYYDKKHLFRMGEETRHFSAGTRKVIIPYMGWNICLLICYDLRFPVWSRNRENEYDLLIYVASWPDSRRHVWDILLPARALENMSYVCGVNRIGTDGNQLHYNGGSIVYSPKGEILASTSDNTECTCTVELSLSSLQKFREKFPVWKDADGFKLC